jgi:hypothetical protein
MGAARKIPTCQGLRRFDRVALLGKVPGAWKACFLAILDRQTLVFSRVPLARADQILRKNLP